MEEARGLAASCMVETAEGPVPIAETPGKGFPVLTRLPSGRTRSGLLTSSPSATKPTFTPRPVARVCA